MSNQLNILAAYFNRTAEALLGLIDRTTFEHRLRAHFESQDPSSRQDTAWYALRNTVYATGCRITAADGAHLAASTEAHGQAWQYFQNALSVHTDLVCVRSGTSAIEALAVMVSFRNYHYSLKGSNRSWCHRQSSQK